ncbi:hypothetical protein AVEN_141317-1 [Araneus ventricosus]|uniref:Uncharacterized protein n=1 Tax=Araneus ventricosus TaxID=182803 RepID=A0A4Y2KUP2_ARAVE|nr:hypothetical protein AVEN_141317-1 [Araneus ventricosus]
MIRFNYDFVSVIDPYIYDSKISEFLIHFANFVTIINLLQIIVVTDREPFRPGLSLVLVPTPSSGVSQISLETGTQEKSVNLEFKVKSVLEVRIRQCWPGNKITTSDCRNPGSKPDSTEEPPCKRAWCTLNPWGPNVLPFVWCGSLERGVPAQVPSSSSDRGQKLRGLSQNRLRVAAKQDVNLTKLN